MQKTLEMLTFNEPCTFEQVQEAGLNFKEYELAKKIVGRAPSKLETGIIASMWSEHCSYKSSRKYLKNLPSTAPHVLVGPGENAGVVDIGDGLALAFKVESHNHPSYIEPYEGAATGMGGILRDVFTMGARPIAAMNLLRFGSPNHAKTSYLTKGVVAGISNYGNSFGVPTIYSDIDFHPSYNGNILVNAFALGLVKHDEIFLGVAEGVGNSIFYVGAKTGGDGIHGATMASGSFESDTEAKRPTVQVGDPFKEKILLEACLECFKQKLIVGIQDMGAAGLTSSSFEMAGRSGTGVVLDLSKVPLRAANMSPYEIMLSESQERMLLVAKPGCEEQINNIYKKWDLDCTQIGEVTGDGQVRLRWQGTEVCALPALALSEEAPLYDRPWSAPEIGRVDASFASEKTLQELLEKVVVHPSVSDQSWNTEQYDSQVQVGTIAAHQVAEAAVVRVKGLSKKIAMTLISNSRLCALDPYEGVRRIFAEAMLRLACVGAKPLAVSDCLNYGSPEKELGMWQLKSGIEALGEMASVCEVPVISGNVSLYNETGEDNIYPTPTLGMVGLSNESNGMPTLKVAPGDSLYLLGEFAPNLCGAETIFDDEKLPYTPIKKLDANALRELLKNVIEIQKSSHVSAIRVVKNAGLLHELVKIALANDCGLNIQVPWEELGPSAIRGRLFGALSLAVVVACRAENDSMLSSFSHSHYLGKVSEVACVIRFSDKSIETFDLARLSALHANSFRKVVNAHE